jgi:hypothetical protein
MPPKHEDAPDVSQGEGFETPAPAEPLQMSPGLEARIRETMDLAPDAPIDLDHFLLTYAIVGPPADRAWVADVCLPRTNSSPLNLTLVRHYLLSLFQERDKLLEQSMRPAAAALRPEDLTVEQIPLELAAQALYYACYPEVREHFDIATEQTQEPLNRVMLGIFGKYRDELHSPDLTLVPEISAVVQYGGRGLDQRGRVAGRPVNEHGEFLRTCKCCHTEFQPPKGRPNPDFCTDGTCGDFDHALQTWAWNAVRYADQGMGSLPKPDPYQFRIRPEGLSHAMAFMGERLEHWTQDAERRVHATRGAA